MYAVACSRVCGAFRGSVFAPRIALTSHAFVLQQYSKQNSKVLRAEGRCCRISPPSPLAWLLGDEIDGAYECEVHMGTLSV
jgi:hypothetical protein